MKDVINARDNLSMLPSFYTHEEYEKNSNIRKAAGLKWVVLQQ